MGGECIAWRADRELAPRRGGIAPTTDIQCCVALAHKRIAGRVAQAMASQRTKAIDARMANSVILRLLQPDEEVDNDQHRILLSALQYDSTGNG
jgi:hypothetical protein